MAIGNILVVDDETYTRELLETLLQDEGYTVSTARDGFEAIDKIKEQNFNLVCLDVRMPGLNGVETLAELRKINQSVAVLMITGYGPSELIKKAELDYNIAGCIYKPFEIEDFLNKIKEVIK